MSEVARRSRDGGRGVRVAVLSPSFAIAQQPPRQRGPFRAVINRTLFIANLTAL